MRKLILALIGVMLIATLAFAALQAPVHFDHDFDRGYEFSAVQFGLINSNATTTGFDLGRMYSSFWCEFTRIGTADIVVHLQGSKFNLAFANFTGSSGHTVDLDTDNFSFGIPVSAGHKARFVKLKSESGADTTHSLTNAVCAGGVR